MKSPGGHFISVLPSDHLVSSENASLKEFQGQTQSLKGQLPLQKH
jgi:hypothetical protein